MEFLDSRMEQSSTRVRKFLSVTNIDFNEYVVFDPAQVKIRYLFQIKYDEKELW